MQVISESYAKELWNEYGFINIFSFEEYISLLERTHIYVVREERKE